MAHNVSVSSRYNREEGNSQDLSLGAVIGLTGAAAAAAMAGCEIGGRAAGYTCDRISEWWNNGKENDHNNNNRDDQTTGQH